MPGGCGVGEINRDLAVFDPAAVPVYWGAALRRCARPSRDHRSRPPRAWHRHRRDARSRSRVGHLAIRRHRSPPTRANAASGPGTGHRRVRRVSSSSWPAAPTPSLPASAPRSGGSPPARTGRRPGRSARRTPVASDQALRCDPQPPPIPLCHKQTRHDHAVASSNSAVHHLH